MALSQSIGTRCSQPPAVVELLDFGGSGDDNDDKCVNVHNGVVTEWPWHHWLWGCMVHFHLDIPPISDISLPV